MRDWDFGIVLHSYGPLLWSLRWSHYAYPPILRGCRYCVSRECPRNGEVRQMESRWNWIRAGINKKILLSENLHGSWCRQADRYVGEDKEQQNCQSALSGVETHCQRSGFLAVKREQIIVDNNDDSDSASLGKWRNLSFQGSMKVCPIYILLSSCSPFSFQPHARCYLFDPITPIVRGDKSSQLLLGWLFHTVIATFIGCHIGGKAHWSSMRVVGTTWHGIA